MDDILEFLFAIWIMPILAVGAFASVVVFGTISFIDTYYLYIGVAIGIHLVISLFAVNKKQFKEEIWLVLLAIAGFMVILYGYGEFNGNMTPSNLTEEAKDSAFAKLMIQAREFFFNIDMVSATGKIMLLAVGASFSSKYLYTAKRNKIIPKAVSK